MLPALPSASPVSEVQWPASSSGTSSLEVMHSNAISEIKPKSPGFAFVLAQHGHSVACPWRPHTAGEKKGGEFNTAQSFYVGFMLLPGWEIIQYKHKSRALISKLSWLFILKAVPQSLAVSCMTCGTESQETSTNIFWCSREFGHLTDCSHPPFNHLSIYISNNAWVFVKSHVDATPISARACLETWNKTSSSPVTCLSHT